MAYAFSGKNCFRWPAKDDILTYELEVIIAVIDINTFLELMKADFLVYNRKYECYETSYF